MKKTAKITAAALAATVALSLSACGNNDFDYSSALDENGFFTGVKASDIVTLPEYKGAEMDRKLIVASEEAVQNEINGILSQLPPEYEKITDGTVADGTMLNIDYVGSIDGEEFPTGTTNGNGATVTIGVTNYIDDFLYQLIGHKPGDTVNVEVTFPEDYGNPDLNGKDALFVTKINYICGEKLEPELTDEIAVGYGYENKEALVSDIENWLVESGTSNFVNELLGSATCENVPQEIIDYFADLDMAQLKVYANQYGMIVDDYLKNAGYDSKEAYIEAGMASYKSSATMALAVQAIAELEGLSVTDEDITAAGITDEDIEFFGMPYIKQYILQSKLVTEFIVENAKLVDVVEEETAETEDNTEVTDGDTENND